MSKTTAELRTAAAAALLGVRASYRFTLVKMSDLLANME